MDTVPERRLLERLRRLPTALRQPAIPLADLGLLRRPLVRTTAARLGLLVALAALAAVSIWRATQRALKPRLQSPQDCGRSALTSHSGRCSRRDRHTRPGV